MKFSATNTKAQQQANRYATLEDFRKVFDENVDEMYQLAYLLTADHEKAKTCFVAGLDDSLRASDVFKEWARSWAKRAIVNNAIRMLRPRPDTALGEIYRAEDSALSPEIRPEHLAAADVLALPDFERFVFVMHVLEGYSESNSALLLGGTLRDVRQARLRAMHQVLSGQFSPKPAPAIQQEARA